MNDAETRRRLVRITILLMAAGCAAAQPAAVPDAPPGNFEGVWLFGSPRRSSEVPFLRISRKGREWIVETKHYMRDHFVSTSRNIRVNGNRLEFTYWYEPLRRPARCILDLTDDRLAGVCDGELDARGLWGGVPTNLWRSPPLP